MKIGFNCSSFDLLHAGHVTMLKMEKELCDYLSTNNIDDPAFETLWTELKPNISIAEIADSFLHRKEFKNMIILSKHLKEY